MTFLVMTSSAMLHPQSQLENILSPSRLPYLKKSKLIEIFYARVFDLEDSLTFSPKKER